jgi:predicted short-subunit dehydrogenase-like oxidoreductase (DUF2520 family)
MVENGQEVVCVVSRSMKSARIAGRFLGCRNVSTSLDAIPPDASLIYITTPHEAVADVARSLTQVSALPWKRLSVCHASGMLSAGVLEPIARKGATVFSFHPLQTFPRNFRAEEILPTARGIFYGVDGTPRSVRVARRFARALEGRAIEIPPSHRALYHAACVLASNHVTTMLWVLQRMHRAVTGSDRQFYPIYRPIIQATLRNIERSSPAEALSGPIARGGVETVSRHFEAMQRYLPEVIPYFIALSRETVGLAQARGSLSDKLAGELETLMQAYSLPLSTTKESR